MSRLAVITPAHKPYSGDLMERSARRVGIEVLRYCEDKPWPNDFRVAKMVDALEFLRTLPDTYTHVMFVDSSDSLFLGGEDEILAAYGNQREDVLIQGEKNCYPHPGLRYFYESLAISDNAPAPTPWCFVNSGGWIADRYVAEKSLETAQGLGTFCDQYCWTLAYLLTKRTFRAAQWKDYVQNSPQHTNGMVQTSPFNPRWADQLPCIGVDDQCSIFQSMYLQQPEEFEMPNGRLHNLVTGRTPCVLHWNGTKNQGIPFSRAGIWYTRDIEPRHPCHDATCWCERCMGPSPVSLVEQTA